MLTVVLRFPSGRYHATPWGQHVNEGAVEWPPSPWRLLRALIATWHLKAVREIDETTLRDLIEALAMDLPRYSLPPATASHTRHYMPIGQLKDGVERTAKVFDTFVHVGAEATLKVVWTQTHLPVEQLEALRLLLFRMSYLGRAESWVEAVHVSNGDSLELSEVSDWVMPVSGGQLSRDQELVRLLCPQRSGEIAAWRSGAFEKHLDALLAKKRRALEAKGKDASKAKLTKADKESVDSMYPKNLIDALHVDTAELQRQGWNEAPGAHWVDYARPRDALHAVARGTSSPSSSGQPTVARFALASQVPPRLTELLRLTPLVRRCLMSHSDASPVFSGKDASGTPLTGNRHAYVLPEVYEAGAEHGRISHVTVYAPMGFDPLARQALEAMRMLWSKTSESLQLVLIGIGGPEDFAGLNTATGQCPLFAGSTTWMSRTPFVPTRHPKATHAGTPKLDGNGLQIGSPEHDLRRLLAEGGFPEPQRVEAIPHTELGGKPTPWLQFKTVRKTGGGARTSNRGHGFRLTFSEPVRGPIVVGYGAHFGLGMFVPA